MARRGGIESGTAEHIAAALSFLAVDRRLGGVLLVDLPPALLVPLAHWLNVAADGHADDPRVVVLGAVHSDDELWSRSTTTVDGDFRFGPAPGLLVEPPGELPRTVVVPDLARATLAVVRAAVVLIGADHAVAERHGGSHAWSPRSRWLAACARADLARLSPHLLDRFAVRVDAADFGTHPSPDALRDALDVPNEQNLPSGLPTPPRIVRDRPLPHLSSAAAALAVATVGPVHAPTRRDLALARAARAAAVLEGAPVAAPEHVERAAAVLGLTRVAKPQLGQPPDDDLAEPLRQDPSLATSLGPTSQRAALDPAQTRAGHARAILDKVAVPSENSVAPLYPEDGPDALAEYASLREPWHPRSHASATRGQTVGTEPARDIADLALLASAVEAAKYRRVRQQDRLDGEPRLTIRASDLRQHRRRPRPDTVLVLVLDHTCRRGWDWSAALAPYLRWAHVRHAALTVVELGHRDTADELRAERYRTTNVLDVRLATSLERPIGRATPLASALDLALQDMRGRLRRGGTSAEGVWLVVVSDGRGNVPLAVSLRGELPHRVDREGVDDSVRVAANLGALTGTHRILLAPPNLTYRSDLPFALASAMNGLVAETGGSL